MLCRTPKKCRYKWLFALPRARKTFVNSFLLLSAACTELCSGRGSIGYGRSSRTRAHERRVSDFDWTILLLCHREGSRWVLPLKIHRSDYVASPCACCDCRDGWYTCVMSSRGSTWNARPPIKLMNVCDMKLADEDGSLFRNMMTKQRASSWRNVHGSIAWPARSCFNLCIWTREKPNWYHWWDANTLAPSSTSRGFFQEVITVTKKIENAVQSVIEFCFQSLVIEDVGHDALWLTCWTRLVWSARDELLGDCCDEFFIERIFCR